MTKPGSIIKVTVVDFVTFSHCQLLPGSGLNIIVGPNGSGKSSMVAAIILGLGGTPKIVGRGLKISDYIKHGRETASISIKLQGNSNDTHTITREFNQSDQTVWKLNGTKSNSKEIMNLIKTFNIQVNNLCQFLPQDRVAEFAKLDKQHLLKETMKALCHFELNEKQEKLVQYRDRNLHLGESLSEMMKNRESLIQVNMRMDGRIKSLEKKKKIMEKIEHVVRKRLWVLYLTLSERRDQLKQVREQAVRTFQGHYNAAKPMNNAISKAKEECAELGKIYKISVSELAKIETALQNDITHSFTQRIDDMKNEKELRLKEVQGREDELQVAEKKMAVLAQDKAELTNKIGTDHELTEKLQTLRNEEHQFSVTITGLENKKSEFSNIKRCKENEVRNLQKQLERLENVKDQKLEVLARLDPAAHRGTLWLRKNRHMFEGEVFEPLLLEINVINPKHAKYIEKTISGRDKCAFLCTSKRDMNLLIKQLVEQCQINVDVLHSEARSNSDQYRPKHRIEELRKFGFQAYLSSLIKAPEPIMNYLRKNYRVHSIPVAFESNNIPHTNMPRDITLYYKGDTRVSISFSKYTNTSSARQVEIKTDKTMSLSVDEVQMEQVRAQIAEIEKNHGSFDVQIRSINERIDDVTAQKDKTNDNMRVLKSCKQQIENIEARLRVMDNKVRDLKANRVTVEDIESNFKENIDNVLIKMRNSIQQRMVAYKNFTNKKIQHSKTEHFYNACRKRITVLENKFEDLKALLAESEIALNKAKEDVAEITRESRILLNNAKEASGGCSPEDDQFGVYREEYDKLPDQIDELDGIKQNLEGQFDCLVNAADQNEVVLYQERVEKIKTLTEKITAEELELAGLTEKIDDLLEQWVNPLKELINEINLRFSRCFSLMDCVGEVSLYTSDDEKDFGKYGICVKVTYRNGQPLQELNNMIQSGGERAVATAIYMLSLQELTPVPFRCVDEINQGMDENNERKVHELLVDLTNLPDTSQYFLITPKLLDRLKYSPTLTMHIVHNGPFTCNSEKWAKALHEPDESWTSA